MSMTLLPLLLLLDSGAAIEISKCAAMKDNTKRLDCFDSVAKAIEKTQDAKATGIEKPPPFKDIVVQGKPWVFMYGPNPRIPDQPAVWLLNLESGKIYQLVNNQKFYQLEVTDKFISDEPN